MEQNSFDLVLLFLGFLAALSLPVWIGIVAVLTEKDSE